MSKVPWENGEVTTKIILKLEKIKMKKLLITTLSLLTITAFSQEKAPEAQKIKTDTQETNLVKQIEKQYTPIPAQKQYEATVLAGIGKTNASIKSSDVTYDYGVVVGVELVKKNVLELGSLPIDLGLQYQTNEAIFGVVQTKLGSEVKIAIPVGYGTNDYNPSSTNGVMKGVEKISGFITGLRVQKSIAQDINFKVQATTNMTFQAGIGFEF